VLVVADSDGAQTTDFIVPYGVLKDSGVADVRSVSTRAGPIRMTRGLQIVADETISEFDAREKAGADIVIVPAQAKPNSRALTTWLRAQAAMGAIMISVCDGARVLAEAGLLDGKRAVTHWASRESLTKSHPATTWLRDRRYVQDGAVITTAGVTASLPASLAVVEAIGGRQIAEVTARPFGVAAWGSEHRTDQFSITSSDRAAAAQAQRSRQELTEIPIENGVDEVSLALQTEVWNRSMRTKVLTTRQGRTPVRSRRGLVIVPDAETKPGSHVVPATSLAAMPALKATLVGMGQRYGTALVRLAIMGMEFSSTSGSN
jgi:transcriptional regulator GlxA family with amidase domain